MIDEGGATNTAPHLTTYATESRTMARRIITQVPIIKECLHCHKALPITQYYIDRRSADQHMPYCKECAKKVRRKNALPERRHRGMPGNKGEAILIDYLRSKGIYAAPGKCSEWSWVDVIVWGCVRCECKYCFSTKGRFSWNFSVLQVRDGISADVVVFICDDGKSRTFHLIDASNPVFERLGESDKWSLAYTKNAQNHKTGKLTAVLSDEVMDVALDNLDVIRNHVEKTTILLKRLSSHNENTMLEQFMKTHQY